MKNHKGTGQKSKNSQASGEKRMNQTGVKNAGMTQMDDQDIPNKNSSKQNDQMKNKNLH